MATKYELGFSKPIEGSRWKHLVSVWFNYQFHDKNADITVVYKRVRSEFLEFMKEHYGPENKRWSVRWADYGADVRFDNTSDAGSFIMFYTKPSPMDRFYRENNVYSGMRGH
jgi:hypothetical protein